MLYKQNLLNILGFQIYFEFVFDNQHKTYLPTSTYGGKVN